MNVALVPTNENRIANQASGPCDKPEAGVHQLQAPPVTEDAVITPDSAVLSPRTLCDLPPYQGRRGTFYYYYYYHCAQMCSLNLCFSLFKYYFFRNFQSLIIFPF